MGVEDTNNTIVDLGQGNPGAIRVLADVHVQMGIDEFSSVVQGLRVMKFFGPAIWLCYKDYAGQDLRRFVAAVKERNEDMQEVVNREMRR